ncbi:zinc-finger of mitochondrial splicing suppressor 51-domain-containing protein [Pisolithus marmoratus]|nr:zinc-finger of mitochondrial splicing suppressor 51-domain-containing protein [Pisolithus marmoratus]
MMMCRCGFYTNATYLRQGFPGVGLRHGSFNFVHTTFDGHSMFTRSLLATLRRSEHFPAYSAGRQSAGRYRTFLNLFRNPRPTSQPLPTLSDNNLFHPFSKSPFPAVRARGEAIQSLALCPVCTSDPKHAGEVPSRVKYECPDCGWPTHCSEEHWRVDEEHEKYCSRLREVNEDEHDLRRGRKMREFQLPGPQAYEEAISFANWDLFWYTRGFPSMDTERSRRHASKLLTYPLTIGSVLHQNSGLTLNNRRVTLQGSRSLAALRTTLHVPPGAPDTEEAGAAKPQIRVFILGARAESSLPPHVWEQLCMLFPSCHFHLLFIGPQVSLPKPADEAVTKDTGLSASSTMEQRREYKESPSLYVPNIYEPPTPKPIVRLKRTRSSVQLYGFPSYTVPYTPQLTITGIQANYSEVHQHFEESFDPYADVFFLFSPGFGFPSMTSVSELDGTPLLQINSPIEWGPAIPALLETRCSVIVTGFSPADMERDVRSLENAPNVAGEFEWVINPGVNAFGSEKWEVADFDPRVMVKANWGLWAIRGRGRQIWKGDGNQFSSSW